MTGGESEIGDISVLIVADVIFEPDPDKSKMTTLSGKFAATNWFVGSARYGAHMALRVSSMRSITLAFAAI
jgi:hypothetical protein